MEIAKLEVLLTGDIKPLEAALKEASADVQQFATKGATGLTVLNAGLSNTAKSALAAATDMKGMIAALDVLQAEQSGIIRGSQLWIQYQTAIKGVNKQLDVLEAQVPVVTTEMKVMGATSTTSLSSVSKGLGSALSGMKNLAFLIPGIGIAGLFDLAFQAIVAAAEALFDFNKELTQTQRIQNELGEIVKAAGNDFVTASTKITQLTADVQLAKDGFLDKDAVVREYNKTLGEAIGKVETFDQAEKAIIDHGQDYIHAMFLRAIANQALEESAKKAFEQQQKALQPSTDFLDKSQKVYNNAASVFDKLDNVLFTITNGILGKQTQSPFFTGIDNQIKEVSGSLDDATAAFQIFQKFFADAEKFAKEHQIKLFPFGDLGKAKEDGEKLKKIAKDTFEPIRLNQLAIIDNNKLLFEIPTEPAKKMFTNVTGVEQITLMEDFNRKLALSQELAEALAQSFANMFKQFATTGKLSFKAVEQGLASLLAKMAETVIEAALLAAILSILPGGSSFSAIWKTFGGLKGIFGHAEGGIFTQPTLLGNQLVGEAGPEALIPLSQLQNMVGGMGNTQRVEVVGRISGNDIVLIQNRQNVRNNRNYGSNFGN